MQGLKDRLSSRGLRVRHLWIVLLVLLSTSTGTPLSAQQPDSARVAAEHAVISVVLDTVYTRVFPDTFIVGDTTWGEVWLSGRPLVENTIEHLNLNSDIKADWIAQRNNTINLQATHFSTSRPVVLRQNRPTAESFILFSRVAFNSDMTEALVHHAFLCGDRCFISSLTHLVMVNGVWVMAANRPTGQG